LNSFNLLIKYIDDNHQLINLLDSFYSFIRKKSKNIELNRLIFIIDMPLKNLLNQLDNNSKKDIFISLIRIYTKNQDIKNDNSKNQIKFLIIKILMQICIDDNYTIKSYFSMNILSNLILKEFILQQNEDSDINSNIQKELLLLITLLTDIIKSDKNLRNELNKNYLEEIERFIILEKKNFNSNLSLPLKSFLFVLLDKNEIN